jgi:SSS family solute:Na+ symporter
LGRSFYEFRTGMAQALTIAIVAWSVCFVVTVIVSLLTKPEPDAKLKGLVYGLTAQPSSKGEAWFRNPLAIGLIVLFATLALNLLFV